MDESPLGDELGRALGALSEWAQEHFPPVAPGSGATTCDWCPVCQFMAVLRGERPELTERVADAGTALLNAVRVLGDAAAAARPRPDRPDRPRPFPRPVPDDDPDGAP